MGRLPKIILALIIIFALVFAIIFFVNKNKQKQSSSPPSSSTAPPPQTETKKDLSNINPQDYTEVLNKNFQISQTKALEWKKNASFVFLRVQIPDDLNPLKVTETYVYDSPDSPLMYWTIGLNLKGDFLRALIYKNDFLQGENTKKIATQFWQIDWLTAFQKAEKNGGQEFREKNKNGLEINADLKCGEPKGYLYWFISYRALDSDENKVIQVDANSGEVIQPETTPSPQT